jgi:isopentenyl-diphosphate Delta-isomerase
MGLGSCRPLLEGRQHLADFKIKKLMPHRPLFANFGIAQIESSIDKGELNRIHDIVAELECDGLIIHVNPLQEYFQLGGDRFKRAPIETIQNILAEAPYPIMVKEVGHGMGPKSLAALMELPLLAIEFAAFGGTNFSKLESMRNDKTTYHALNYVGHSAFEMLQFASTIKKHNTNIKCQNFIISGGIKSMLDAHALIQNWPNAIVGMAGNILKHAQNGEVSLRNYLTKMKNDYAMARQFLNFKEELI